MKSDKTEVFRGYLANELKVETLLFRDMVKYLEAMDYTVITDTEKKVVRIKQLPDLVFGLDKLSEINEHCNINEEAIQLVRTGDDMYDCRMDASYLLLESTCFQCRANQRGKK